MEAIGCSPVLRSPQTLLRGFLLSLRQPIQWCAWVCPVSSILGTFGGLALSRSLALGEASCHAVRTLSGPMERSTWGGIEASYVSIIIPKWLKLFKEKKICHDHESCPQFLEVILDSLRLQFSKLCFYGILMFYELEGKCFFP